MNCLKYFLVCLCGCIPFVEATPFIGAPSTFTKEILLSNPSPFQSEDFAEDNTDQYYRWRTYLAYHNTTSVAEAKENVFALADGSLYSFNKSDKSITYYSREKGLSDNSIRFIAYNSSVERLLIVYENSNIDILSEDGIYNIPFLKDNIQIQDKTINQVFIEDKKAYLSGSFGIMVIDMQAQEVADTYRLNKKVNSVCKVNDYLYAATDQGLIRGLTTQNLLDNNNWEIVPLSTTLFNVNSVEKIVFFDNRLCFFISQRGLYYQTVNGGLQIVYENTQLKDIATLGDMLGLYTSSSLYLYSSLTQKETVSISGIAGASARNNKMIWLASNEAGIRAIEENGSATYQLVLDGTEGEGPKRNLLDFMKVFDNKLYIAGGGRLVDRFMNPGTVMIWDGEKWINLDEKEVGKKAREITSSTKLKFSDATSIAVDPQDANHYFVSTWGEGVFEFKEGQLVQVYNHTNSSLQSIFPNNYNYIRVDGLCFDKNNHLWMTNSEVRDGISVLSSDGKWSSLYYPELNGQYLIDKICVTPENYKWVNILRGSNSGVLVFDDKNTPSDINDDTYNFYNMFKDSNGSVLEINSYNCIVCDQEGEIWIGTNKGPIICPSPDRAITNPTQLYFKRIVRTDDEGNNSYLLDAENITCMAVDAGNRKWLGTESSGVVVVSPDGLETIHHFNTSTSPILSNKIKSIQIIPQSGEVFIGTDQGLISYKGEATEGHSDYDEVGVYPNPVRPEYDDHVTITGLMDDSNVKITDINGNLLYQDRSLGGQLIWNCRTASGERVSTGIYLVIASSSDSKSSVVAKIMVVK